VVGTRKIARWAAIIGNVVFILWIVYNAIDSGFVGRPAEIASAIGLLALLALNAFLLGTRDG
jgi:hypothetical protein